MPRWISKKLRRDIHDRDGMICTYCKETCMPSTVKGLNLAQYKEYQKAFMPRFATLDHIVARNNGGALVCPSNLVTVCCACNASKKDTDLKVWCKVTGKNYRAIKRRIERRIAKPIA